MENRDGEIHVDDVEASAGEKSGHMRWVLGISTLLAIVVLSIVWITGALTQGDVEEEVTLKGTLESVDGEVENDTTDSIITEDQIEGSE